MAFRVEARTSAGGRGNEGQETSNRLRITCDHDFLTLGQGLLGLGPVQSHVAHRHPSHAPMLTCFTASAASALSCPRVMPSTPHIEKHFTASEAVRDVVIGMSNLASSKRA